ncbi:MAG: hypothetical protein A3G34_17605 [Candidatus Lindowbacteria bacterium RIFCSPLOWO2_12_FULL_62_27]|nr:MAG: hypothetical protein A3G34_17605 [Candidatus Lindowbacteria bacterium RIFCSPLOWO2_12_FULL_62_27]OGH56746.1 MAG: hypothetical protein A3I06_12770 [Candidatus Lindowbacteria bacterium RIFCSPLOWO2_02_FULL_62_12]
MRDLRVRGLPAAILAILTLAGADPGRADDVRPQIAASDRIRILLRSEGLAAPEEDHLAKLLEEALDRLDLVDVSREIRRGPVSSEELRKRAKAEAVHAFLIVDAGLAGAADARRLTLDGKLIFPEIYDPVWTARVSASGAPSAGVSDAGRIRTGGATDTSKPARNPVTTEQMLEDGARSLTGEFSRDWMTQVAKNKSEQAMVGLREKRRELESLEPAEAAREAAQLARGFERSAEKSFASGAHTEAIEYARIAQGHYERAIGTARGEREKQTYRRERLNLLLEAIRNRIDSVPVELLSEDQRRDLIDLQAAHRAVRSMQSPDIELAMAKVESIDTRLAALARAARQTFQARVREIEIALVSLREWDAPRMDGKTYQEILKGFDEALAGYERGAWQQALIHLRQAERGAQMTLDFLTRHAREHAEEEYLQTVERMGRLIKKLYTVAGDRKDLLETADAAFKRFQTVKGEYTREKATRAARQATDLFRECVQLLQQFQEKQTERAAELKRRKEQMGQSLSGLGQRGAKLMFPDRWVDLQGLWRAVEPLEGERLIEQDSTLLHLNRLIDQMDQSISSMIEQPMSEFSRAIVKRRENGKPWEALERKRRLAEVYLREGLVPDALVIFKELETEIAAGQ